MIEGELVQLAFSQQAIALIWFMTGYERKGIYSQSPKSTWRNPALD